MNTFEETRDVAIIGISCRFPGARDPVAFWRNLCDGVESIRFFERDELAVAGVSASALDLRNYVRASPVLEGVEDFDAAFFRHTTREANLMDPQQRLFLEVAWEAIEAAGYAPEEMQVPVGVFAGSGGVVTSYLAAYRERAPELVGPTGSVQHIGNDKDFLSTRVSYKLNLKGPSINIQTACSTSLVAVHLACRSLLDGECDMAIAGAATIRFPHWSGYLYQSEDIVSPDGHCRAFDARAQGTVFGSGVAAVLLRPLAAAIENGDHIYAVIKGSAINNDGGEKVSYGASSVPGQAGAMVEALAVAGVTPDSIGYVECHATGTTVGDPLEVQALTRAFRLTTERTGFCGIGSVKTNLGHLEQTAGMAALIKTALALKHKQLPPSINFETVNPKLNLETSPFYIQTELSDWKAAGDHPRRAGVNGLGLGGTNAFLVLEEAPDSSKPARGDRPRHVLALSARSQPALLAFAARFEQYLSANPEAPLTDVCFTANVSRAGFAERLAVSADSVAELRRGLASVTGERLAPHTSRGSGRARPVVFVFTGQGAQYPGMGAELYQTNPLFRAALDRCAALVQPYIDCSLLSILFAEAAQADLIHRTEYTQICLFAVEYALAELWRSWGIEPDAVIGHSVGEITAACVAGAIQLEDALKLVALRGKLMQQLPEGGGMAAVFASQDTVCKLLGGRPELSLAASNAPASVVVAGAKQAFPSLFQELRRRSIEFQELVVSHAFHSALMEPMLAELERVAAEIVFRKPAIKLISNLAGLVQTEAPTARYWRDHARGAVQFGDGMQTLKREGYEVFVEIGPGSSLLGLGRQTISEAHVTWVPSLSRRKSDWEVLNQSLRTLYVHGHSVDWAGYDRPYVRRRHPLPTYPFQRKRHFVSEAQMRSGPVVDQDAHPLLGVRLRSALSRAQFHAYYDLDTLAYLDDHRIFGLAVLPTTAGLELIVQGIRAHFGTSHVSLENFLYREAMVVPEHGKRLVQLVVTPAGDHEASFKVFSSDDSPDGAWVEHMEGRARAVDGPVADSIGPAELEALRARCTKAVSVERYYEAIRAMGLEYGAAFRGIEMLWQGSGEALSYVRLPADLELQRYSLHPAFLDACLHIYPALAEVYGDFSVPPEDLRRTFLPISVERFRGLLPTAHGAWVHATRRAQVNPDEMILDIRVYAETGQQVATIEGLRVRRLTIEAMQPSVQAADPGRASLYQLRWTELPVLAPEAGEAVTAPGRWLIFADNAGVGAALAIQLRACGGECEVVYPDAAVKDADRELPLAADQPGRFHRLLRDYFGVPGVSYRHVVYLWALDAAASTSLSFDPFASSAEATLGHALSLVQAVSVVNSVTGAAPRVWFVTRNARRPQAEARATEMAQYPLWALGSAMSLRHADLWGGMIDLEHAAGPNPHADASALLIELCHSDGEDQLALHGGRRLAPRLSAIDSPKVDSGALRLSGEATYLITGGLGAVGLRLADWLVTEAGARNLLLVDRRVPDADADRVLQGLSARGANVVLSKTDLCIAEEVQQLFSGLAFGPPLKGIFHCAWASEDELVDLITWRSFVSGMAPSVRGAWLLHQQSRGLELEQFVLFASIDSWIGTVERTPQAAGGLFLEALADMRRAHGLPATVVHWGPWQESGQRTAAETDAARGVHPLKPDHALTAFEYLLSNGVGQAAVASVDWATLTQQFKRGAPALYAGVQRAGGRQRRASRDDEDPRVSLRRIQQAQAGERRDVVLEVVRKRVTDALGAETLVDPSVPLDQLGLDSLVSVNLVNRLEPAIGVAVPLAKLLQGASVASLVDDLLPALLANHAA